MEYEKRYKDALERARQIKNGENGWGYSDLVEITPALEEVFPELTESEDERIRKWLLDYAIEMIAGLESDISISTYDGIKGHDPEAEAELAQWQKARAYLEKQKEQEHPDGCFTCDEYKKGYEAGRLNGLTAGYNKAMKEQKPAEWTEEDEKKLERVIWYVEKGCSMIFQKSDELISWLKSLPLNLKKKNEDVAKLCSNEWSEEDEEMLVRLLDSISIGNDYKEMRNRLLPKLKSLRPQPHWKPSEEQMGCLERVIAFRNPEPEDIKGCEELLEQLRKL